MEEPVRRFLADAPGHVAVFRYGVLKQVAHHGVFIAAFQVRVAHQIVVDLLEAVGAVVIIGIDDGEGAVYELPGCQDRLSCAPGLHPALGDCIALGQVIRPLEHIVNLHLFCNAVPDSGPEGRLNLRLDDENHRFKAGPVGVK